MRSIVMEGHLNASKQGRVRRHSVFLALTTFACITAAFSSSVLAAQGSGSKKVFEATVLDMSGESRRVNVPMNRSVIVRTTVEVARADVVAADVASVQAVSAKELLVTGIMFGRTNVVLWDKDNHQYVLDVKVEPDLKELTSAAQRIDPQSDVHIDSVLGNIILTGTVSSANRAKRIEELAQLYLPGGGGASSSGPAVQNHLEVAGEQQVLLRCVVAEVSRRAVRELGINGFLAGENVRDAFLVNQIGGINPANIGAAADTLVTEPIPFLTGTDGIPLLEASTLSLGFPRAQTQFFIRALADNALASILAEPNLVAVSGETASFLAGGEFPIPVPQGNQQVTIQFREFGVRLNFTPTVRSHQRIRVRVAPEVSELDFSSSVQIEGFVVPGLTSRAAETTVEMGSGQTIAIAGLLNEQVRGIASRVPGIGDVPVLGSLFRSVNFQRSLSELVILVTPEIVAPLEVNQGITLPNAGVKSPSDFELYMSGMLQASADDSQAVVGEEDATKTAMLDTQPDELFVHGPWGHTESQ